VRHHKDVVIRVGQPKFAAGCVEGCLNRPGLQPLDRECLVRRGNVLGIEVEKHGMLLRNDRVTRLRNHDPSIAGFEPSPYRSCGASARTWARAQVSAAGLWLGAISIQPRRGDTTIHYGSPNCAFVISFPFWNIAFMLEPLALVQEYITVEMPARSLLLSSSPETPMIDTASE
jgi:hypothetical protein